jgi:plasmid stability protein
MNPNQEPLSAIVDAELKSALIESARENDRSLGAELRRILRQWLTARKQDPNRDERKRSRR